MFGSFAESGLDNTHCFDRSGRLGLYGLDTVRHRTLLQDSRGPDVDWNKVNWGQLQVQCEEANKARFGHSDGRNMVLAYPDTEKSLSRSGKRSLFAPSKKYRDRKAVLLRAWQGMEYTPELLQSVRAMVSELSIHSCGEYFVYLVVEIKDKDRPILTSPDFGAYQKALDDIVPHEFHNMTILFNQDLLKAWYPEVDQAGGQSLHMNQPLQLFSIMNPDFAFVWQFELDVRYTGSWYNFLGNADSWARKQPRKLQFERAAKFYIPSFHGSYANFSDSVEAANPDGGVWGPVQSGAVLHPLGPEPSTKTAAEDDYTWGVGEEADVISVSPIIDLNHTELFKLFKISNFPEGQDPPRRSLMVTPVVRLSGHLLKSCMMPRGTKAWTCARRCLPIQWRSFMASKSPISPYRNTWTTKGRSKDLRKLTDSSMLWGPRAPSPTMLRRIWSKCEHEVRIGGVWRLSSIRGLYIGDGMDWKGRPPRSIKGIRTGTRTPRTLILLDPIRWAGCVCLACCCILSKK